MAWARVVPEKCSTINLESSAGSATPAAASRPLAACSSGPSKAGSTSAIDAHVGEQLRLMIGDERVDHLVEFAHHHSLELIKGEVDAVIGDPSLREIVGADAFRPVARADLRFSRLRPLFIRAATLQVVKPGPEYLHGARPVLVLRLFRLHHHDAGGQMGDSHRRIGGVDVLAAGTGSAHCVDA